MIELKELEKRRERERERQRETERKRRRKPMTGSSLSKGTPNNITPIDK